MPARTLFRLLMLLPWLMLMPDMAGAEAFAMSSGLRNFCCTNWISRDQTPTPAPNPGGGAFAFVGGEVVQGAHVSRTVDQDILGAAPFGVAIPASRLSAHISVTNFQHPNPLIDTLTLHVDMDNKPGSFAAGGGPGDFEFCPAAVGPAPGACAEPLFATSGTGTTAQVYYHGRIAVEAGPNQFGGAMGWLGPGLQAVLHVRNAPGISATRFTQRNASVPMSMIGAYTGVANTLPTAASILAFASVSNVSTSYGTSMYQTNPSAVPISTMMGGGRATGHLWTTGMVLASVTAGVVPGFLAVTLTGSDTRETTGPNRGHGNLTLVSANLQHDFERSFSSVRGNVLRMTLPEPAAGLGVALGALGLVVVGVARSGFSWGR